MVVSFLYHLALQRNIRNPFEASFTLVTLCQIPVHCDPQLWQHMQTPFGQPSNRFRLAKWTHGLHRARTW